MVGQRTERTISKLEGRGAGGQQKLGKVVNALEGKARAGHQ